MRIVLKTLSYSAMHITIAVTLAYLLTGNWAIALGIGILEPVVQTLAFPLHEWLWERKKPNLDLMHGACRPHGLGRQSSQSPSTNVAVESD